MSCLLNSQDLHPFRLSFRLSVSPSSPTTVGMRLLLRHDLVAAGSRSMILSFLGEVCRYLQVPNEFDGSIRAALSERWNRFLAPAALAPDHRGCP